jgi:hypothetical protein
MILSKGNLQVVAVTKRDAKLRALDNVHVTCDGSTVGCSGRSVLAVSPVRKKVKKGLPLEEKGKVRRRGVNVSADSIRAVLKDMPKDTKFDGLLEHCNMRKRTGEDVVVFTMSDGKRRRRVEGKVYPPAYVAYDKVLERSLAEREGRKIVLNLDRLLTLLKTVAEICDDSSAETAAFVEFTENNDVIVRAQNAKTKQRCIAVMASYILKEKEWMKPNKWERGFYERD